MPLTFAQIKIIERDPIIAALVEHRVDALANPHAAPSHGLASGRALDDREWVFREGVAVYAMERDDRHEGIPVPRSQHRRRAAVNAFFERTGRMPKKLRRAAIMGVGGKFTIEI